jgi:hypothetical protein
MHADGGAVGGVIKEAGTRCALCPPYDSMMMEASGPYRHSTFFTS